MISELAKNLNIPIKNNKKTEVNNETFDDIENNDEDVLKDFEDDDLGNDFLIDDYDIPYDLVPLPSKGLIYKNRKDKIPVAYLTASDEDLITSPNLYVNDKIIDTLLRKKILDRSINPDNLSKGDRDAIIVWLRSTGYGQMFPVNVKDPVTGENFDYEVDLSQLTYKDFLLTPDENGCFEFKLPRTGHIVKFKIMTHKDEIGYTKLLEKTNPSIKKAAIDVHLSSLKNIIENEKGVESKLKSNLNQFLTYLEEYSNKILSEEKDISLKNVTYLLERSIVSIEGNSDKRFIKKYINNMPAFDSLSLRKFINENTPGIDFTIKIERPESLGGGSFTTFLELTSDIFLNIARI